MLQESKWVFLSFTAVIRQSSSMSYVDGCVGTWPKEKRSAPYTNSLSLSLSYSVFTCSRYIILCLHIRSSAHGISFEIPLDDSSSSSSRRGLNRSASTEGLCFKVHHATRGMRRNLSFQPVNGNANSKIHEEDDEKFSRHRLGNYTGYIFHFYLFVCYFLFFICPLCSIYSP